MPWLPPVAGYVCAQVAVPPDSIVVQIVATPSLNVTVSPFAGVPDPGAFAVTVAVYVTAWPLTDGFADDATAVVVAA